MYANDLIAQAVDYQKTMFDNSYKVMVSLQDQSQNLVDMAFAKNTLIPGDSKKIFSYWADFLKENRENCKEYVDAGFDRMKELLVEAAPVAAPATAKKTAK